MKSTSLEVLFCFTTYHSYRPFITFTKKVHSVFIICLYLSMSNKQKQEIMKEENTTIENILDSKEFNDMFDIENEQKELRDSGWTIEEIRKFAKFLQNNK